MISTGSSRSAGSCRSPRRRITSTRHDWLILAACHRELDATRISPRPSDGWTENFRAYGARKVWRQLNREQVRVARCTVERLMGRMGRMGIEGVRRGASKRTTIPADVAEVPLDRVQRQFTASRPDQL